MNELELFIPAAPKDYNKIPFVIRQAIRFVPGIRAVRVVTPTIVGGIYHTTVPVHYYLDKDFYPFDKNFFGYRSGWIFQQMLKLFQNVTETDYYICVDADLLFLKQCTPFSEDNHPVFFLGNDQYHQPYFDFNRLMFGFEQVYKYSFLSECTLYNKNLTREMASNAANCSDEIDFIDAVIELSQKGIYPADAELYGNWVWKFHPDLYIIRKLKTALGGRYGSGQWNNSEIEERIETVSQEEAEICTIHSWEGG